MSPCNRPRTDDQSVQSYTYQYLRFHGGQSQPINQDNNGKTSIDKRIAWWPLELFISKIWLIDWASEWSMSWGHDGFIHWRRLVKTIGKTKHWEQRGAITDESIGIIRASAWAAPKPTPMGSLILHRYWWECVWWTPLRKRHFESLDCRCSCVQICMPIHMGLYSRPRPIYKYTLKYYIKSS